VWDLTSGAELARMPHDVSVTKVALSPDGKYLATSK
jgi:WD40 repeat protein